MDIAICLLAIPFVIDSHRARMTWKLPEFLCKFFMFADYGLKGVHAYTLLLGSLFLYFHYRKDLSQGGQASKMHKWAIPLAWVLGLGIGVPAGAMATMDNCGRCEVWHAIPSTHDMRRSFDDGNAQNVLLAFLVGGFIVPLVLLVLPLIALFMQLCGARSPKLDPPNSRTAVIMVLFVVLFIVSRAPHDIYELMKMYSNQFGNRGNMRTRNMPGGPSIETQMSLDCMVYIPMLLHPILFILLQPEYRQGLRDILRSCGGGESPRRENPYGEGKQRRFPQAPAPIIRGGGRRFSHNNGGGGQLVQEQQPMIMPTRGGMAQHGKGAQGYPGQGTPYIQQQGYGIPMQQLPQQQLLQQQQPLLNNSFEEPAPQQLPAQ